MTARGAAPAVTALAALLLLAAAPAGLDLRRPAAGPGGIFVASVVSGGEPLEWAGTRLAGGDINGDGIADLVIAAPGGTDDRPSRRGRLYVVFGSVMPPRPLLDLTLRRGPAPAPGAPASLITDAGLVIEGAGDFDHLGRALAVADLDGDGASDIIAGAPRADGPRDTRPDCGEVHVIFGAVSLPAVIRLDQAPSSPVTSPSPGVRTAVIFGRAAGDAFGTALSVGDVTADGFADLVAGAPLADAAAGSLGALDAGEAILIPSIAAVLRAHPALDLADHGSAPAWTVLGGADAGDQAGGALALGDFDGDSAADVAIGARGGDGPANQRPDSGEVYLLFGARPMPPSLALGVAADAFIAAPDIGDLAGGSLAMGDVNGDGRDDLAVGSEFADGRANGRLDAGEVFVIAGMSRDALESRRPPAGETTRGGAQPGPEAPRQPAGPVLIDLAARALHGATVIHGDDPGDHTGVRAIVDLDEDGLAEIVLAAEDAAGRRNARAGSGEVHVLAGRRSLAAELRLDAPEAIVVHGPAGGTHLGGAVTAIDLDGDGRLELIVSAPQAGQSLAGKVFILKAGWKERLHPVGAGK
ncbi:MAG TPA: FG-GAP repeat protein [Candidatus Polarisedimenticolia bacterium]|jgi:hypothetical protein